MTSVRTGSAEGQETLAACLQIFRRLWARQINCHSAETFSSPRSRNLRKPRIRLIWPNTGSTMCFRAAYSVRPGASRTFFAIAVFGFSAAVPLQAAGVEEVSAEPLGTSLHGAGSDAWCLSRPTAKYGSSPASVTPCTFAALKVPAVRGVGDRQGLALLVPRPFDARRGKVGHRRLGHRYCLLLVVRGGRDFRRHNNLVLCVHRGLRVVTVVEALVVAFHDFRIGVGEVRLRLVGGRRLDWCRCFATTLFPQGLTFRFRHVPFPLLFGGPLASLRFQPGLGLPDLHHPVLPTLQFFRQFVAPSAAQRRVLLGVHLIGPLQQGLHLLFQPANSFSM